MRPYASHPDLKDQCVVVTGGGSGIGAAMVNAFAQQGAREFSLYEDDGVSMAYTRGESSGVPLRYDDKAGTVTIGEGAGSSQGMLAKRTFKVQFITAGTSAAGSLDAADKTFNYEGKEITIKR